MIRLSLTLGWLAVCSAALSILMPWYVITTLGVGVQTDAFFASAALPQLIFLVLGASFTQVLVSLLTPNSRETFYRDAWGFFLVVTLIFALLGLVLGTTAGLWVPLVVPGFTPQGKALTIVMTRIQTVSMVCNASVVVLWSISHAQRKFIWVEFSTLIANGVAFLFLIIVLPHQGIVAAAWASVLGMLLKVALLLPVLGPWRLPRWDSQAMKEAWPRVKPLFIGQFYYRTDPLIDRFLASMTSAGGLSLYYISQQVHSVLSIIVNKAFCAPIVPALVEEARGGNWLAYRRIYRERLLWTTGILIAAYSLLLVTGHFVLHSLIGYGGITADNVRTLWWITLASGGVLAGGTIGQITSVAFYALGDTKTPTKLFVWTYTVYVPIKVVAFLWYGLMGLAVATSVYMVINFGLQFMRLEKSLSPAPPETEASALELV